MLASSKHHLWRPHVLILLCSSQKSDLIEWGWETLVGSSPSCTHTTYGVLFRTNVLAACTPCKLDILALTVHVSLKPALAMQDPTEPTHDTSISLARPRSDSVEDTSQQTKTKHSILTGGAGRVGIPKHMAAYLVACRLSSGYNLHNRYTGSIRFKWALIFFHPVG
jgi:hypothetical protein